MLDLYALLALKPLADLPNCKSAPKLSDLTNRKIRSTFSDWLTGLFTAHSLASNLLVRGNLVSLFYLYSSVVGSNVAPSAVDGTSP